MKKKMKIFPTIIASFLVLSAISACTPGETHQGKTVIKYLVSNESAAYKEILNTVVEDFNKIIAEEGYYIETSMPGGDYYESLGRLIASNNTPDIFLMEYGYFNSYVDRMADLSSYLEKSKTLSKNDLWDLNEYYKDSAGQLKAIIKDFSPDFMLIYNKTMLEEYNASVEESKRFYLDETTPVTWDYFYQMTNAIQASGKAQYGTSLGFEGTKHLHEIVQQTGAQMYIDGDKKLNKEDSNLREAFAFYYSLQKDNVSNDGNDTSAEIQKYAALQENVAGKKAPASYTSGSTTSEQELFKQGRCFSIFNGLYSFPSYSFYDVGFEYGIAPHPVQKEGDTPFGTTSAMVSHAISKSSRHKDIAWRFIEYYQTVGMEKLAKIAFNIPGNKTIAGSDAFLKQEDPKVQDVVQFFYQFVNSGYCKPTTYNSLVDYSVVRTCFETAQNKYFSPSNPYTFSQLIDQIGLLIEQQTR